MKNLRLVNIGTTAYSEEDFKLITNLSDNQIVKIIEPIVLAEREGKDEYDNDYLVSALKKKYPKSYIEMWVDADEIII